MRIIRIFTDPWLSTETARVIKSVTLFHQRPYFRHVRQVLFLLFLASQTAGGSRGVLVHVRHPKFPKNRQRVWRFFFALSEHRTHATNRILENHHAPA